MLGLFGLKGQAEVRGNEWNQENTTRHTVIHSWAKVGRPHISWLENSNCSAGTWRLVGQTAVLVRSAPQSQTGVSHLPGSRGKCPQPAAGYFLVTASEEGQENLACPLCSEGKGVSLGLRTCSVPNGSWYGIHAGGEELCKQGCLLSFLLKPFSVNRRKLERECEKIFSTSYQVKSMSF